MTRASQDKPLILVVDDEANLRRVLDVQLSQAGYVVHAAASVDAALASIRDADPDLVLTDLKMPDRDGMDLLARMRADFPEIPVVMLTAHGTIDTAVEAMRRGAFDFLTKPFDKDRALAVIASALSQAKKGRREFQGPYNSSLRCGMIGESAPMHKLCDTIEKVADSPTSVLIRGETGTGKELVAEAIHRLSSRAGKPLVKLNCGAIPETLVEAELFGHVRGAFTGADRERKGRFELADTGTIFLDEVGELPLAAQPKLLRVVQEGVIDPVGGSGPVRVDVRVVAATHRDLQEEVAQGRFREDLFFRLRVIELKVPRLAERTGDIPQLVEFFLDKHAARLDRPRPTVSEPAMAALIAREWPGNVRELENVVERALLLSDGGELTPADFDETAADEKAASDDSSMSLKQASRAAAAAVERRMIRAALGATSGNVTTAARRLGLSRRGLQLKLKDLGLREEDSG